MKFHSIKDLKNATDSEVEEALKEVSVLDDLYKYIQWLNSPEGHQIDGAYRLGNNAHRGLGFHPSAMAKKGECSLKMYYDVTGEVESDQPFDFGMQLIWDLGTMIHSMLQLFLNHMYEDQFTDEVPLRDKKLLIKSHTDGKFVFPSVKFILEIKSAKSGGNYGFEKVQQTPFPDNVRQMMTYMKLSDSPFGLLLYFNKNTSELKEHALAYDPAIWDAIKSDTMDPVNAAIAAGERPAPKVGWHCERCPYYRGCPHGKEHKNDRVSQRRRARRSV